MAPPVSSRILLFFTLTSSPGHPLLFHYYWSIFHSHHILQLLNPILCTNVIFWLAFLLSMDPPISIFPATLESCRTLFIFCHSYVISPSQGWSQCASLGSHSLCAVLCHNWGHSALSISVCVSVSLLDYAFVFEVEEYLCNIHLCNYNSYSKHVYLLESPFFLPPCLHLCSSFLGIYSLYCITSF